MDIDPIILMFLMESSYPRRYQRRFGVHPINRVRRKYGEFHHLYPQLREDEERFFGYFRMSISSFDYLISKIEHRLLTKIVLSHNRRITPTERTVITLRYLITGSSFRSLAYSFRVGKTTVSEIVKNVCQVIWEELVPEFMPVPTEEKLRQVITDYYQRWNFPNCFGSIDCKHCEVICPKNTGSQNFNYLKFFSIVLQGVADADKKFLTIDVGGYGRQHDSTTLRSSALFRKLERKEFNNPPEMTIPGTQLKLPTFLIGDEAYPLLPYLMRPYSGRNMTSRRDRFNKRLSRARKCIECAFGILTRKFSAIARGIQTDAPKAIRIIKCACVLHNFIRTRDGDSDLDYRYMSTMIYDENENTTASQGRRVNLRGRRNNAAKSAKETRDKLANYFLTN